MNSLVSLSTFSLLCDHHRQLSPELVHLPKLKLRGKSTPHPSSSPVPGEHCSTFCLSEFDYLWNLTSLAEKAMATHSSTLAWKIPWTEGPGRLQSMGSLGVGHDWATSLSLFICMHWRRKWQPIPVFLPGESQGRGSLVGCRLWGLTESDTTEAT